MKLFHGKLDVGLFLS